MQVAAGEVPAAATAAPHLLGRTPEKFRLQVAAGFRSALCEQTPDWDYQPTLAETNSPQSQLDDLPRVAPHEGEPTAFFVRGS